MEMWVNSYKLFGVVFVYSECLIYVSCYCYCYCCYVIIIVIIIFMSFMNYILKWVSVRVRIEVVRVGFMNKMVFVGWIECE